MSYLGLPRMHFAGRFTPDISTINNTASNFDPSVAITANNAGFSPNGTGNWQLQDCTVTAVTYLDGTSTHDAQAEPLIGQEVAGTDQPVPAKLVDLDPQQQGVSEIWGLELRIGSSAVVGHYAVAPFSDMWGRAQGGGGSDTTLAAYYQSVLNGLRWGDLAGSRFLDELKATSPDLLSIKFMLDGVAMTTSPEGRIVGTIGPASADEPERFVAGRLLRTPVSRFNPTRPTGPRPLFFAPCEVDAKRSVLVLDMGNSIPTATPGGEAADIGELTLAALPANADPVPLGKIDYLSTPAESQKYEKTAFIQEFPLTADQLELIASTPLGIVQINPTGDTAFTKTRALAPTTVLLAESGDGSYVRADQFVFRMNSGDVASLDLWVRRFGQPVAGETVALTATQGLISPPMGQPASALTFPATSPPTDAAGKTTVELTASDPGTPRPFIDGQVYGVAYAWGSPRNPDPWDFVSILVHTDTIVSGTPTWDHDVEPIFSQYHKLYPVMQQFVDLGDYGSVKTNAQRLRQVMALPMADPAYMPVTRDLSRSKLEMIMAWFAAGMPES